MNELNYYVAFTIPGNTQDDKKDKMQIIAGFRYPHQADDFIKNCLPEETRNRFYIVKRGPQL